MKAWKAYTVYDFPCYKIEKRFESEKENWGWQDFQHQNHKYR